MRSPLLRSTSQRTDPSRRVYSLYRVCATRKPCYSRRPNRPGDRERIGKRARRRTAVPLGGAVGSREVGLVAAVLLMTSPPFWFDGEVALPYVVEGCASITLAFLLYMLRMGEARVGALAAVVFAIAIGMRQQLALFLCRWHCMRIGGRGWRVRLESLAWFTFVCLLWFVPLLWSVGGLAGYLNAVRGLNSAFSSEYVLFGTGGIEGMIRNGSRVGANDTLCAESHIDSVGVGHRTNCAYAFYEGAVGGCASQIPDPLGCAERSVLFVFPHGVAGTDLCVSPRARILSPRSC